MCIPISRLPLYDMAVRLNAVPATGPSVTSSSSSDPAMYIGNGAAGRFDVAKSSLAACARANRVTVDVGSRFATLARSATSPAPCTPERSLAISALTIVKRSEGLIAMPGKLTFTGVKALVPVVASVRVETTNDTLSDSTAMFRFSWYRRAPLTAPVTKKSLIEPPSDFPTDFTSARGSRSASRRRWRDRCFHREEPLDPSFEPPN